MGISLSLPKNRYVGCKKRMAHPSTCFLLPVGKRSLIVLPGSKCKKDKIGEYQYHETFAGRFDETFGHSDGCTPLSTFFIFSRTRRDFTRKIRSCWESFKSADSTRSLIQNPKLTFTKPHATRRGNEKRPNSCCWSLDRIKQIIRSFYGKKQFMLTWTNPFKMILVSTISLVRLRGLSDTREEVCYS